MGSSAALSAPSGYDQLWRDYGDYMGGLVAKLAKGFHSQDVQDMTGNIMAYLLESDVIGQYDPAHVSGYTGKPVTFRAFLSSKVALYVRGQREKLNRHGKREALICDAVLDGQGGRWIDFFGGQWWDDYEVLSDTGSFERMRTYLALVPRSGRCDLLALFDELLREVRAGGAVSLAEVRSRFGINPDTCRAWMGKLRAALEAAQQASAPARPLSWSVGGVSLTPADARSAITVLEAARGIMVRQPLAAAGHPLAAAEAGWYHPFAKAEIKEFPEIAVDPQTHKKPAGHVKIAVLHRLARMLAEAAPAGPAAVPGEPPAEAEDTTPWDELEAMLWRHGFTPAEVDQARSLAVAVA